MIANRTPSHWFICMVIVAGVIFGFHLTGWLAFPLAAVVTTLLPNDYSLT